MPLMTCFAKKPGNMVSKLNKQQQRRIRAAVADKIQHYHLQDTAVVVTHLGYQLVLVQNGVLITADWRKQSGDIACNDQVLIRRTSEHHAVVEAVLPRGKTLCKWQGRKAKPIAANISQLLIVIACRPNWQESLVDRYLIAARKAGISPAVYLNKTDLLKERDTTNTQSRLIPYQQLGIPVFSGTLPEALPRDLVCWLEGEQTVLCGQSGVGKSSLIRTLKPDCDIWIQAISQATQLGRHTTTNLRLYSLSDDTAVIDTPGVRSFALNYPVRADIMSAFPDIDQYIRYCRFNDCNHQNAPDCAVLKALNEGHINAARYHSFLQLLEEYT